MDANHVGLEDTTGLDLACGYAVWCHYRSDQVPMVREWSRETGRRVLCLSERTGLVREAGDLRVVGHESVYRIDHEELTKFRIGERIAT